MPRNRVALNCKPRQLGCLKTKKLKKLLSANMYQQTTTTKTFITAIICMLQ